MEKLIIILPLFILLIAFAALYAFSIMPRISKSAREKTSKFKKLFIAHRGLHSGDIKENTGEAFRAAVDAGFGFEFDVRLSSDNIPVVLHDLSLQRVFGVSRNADDMTAAELSELGVPTLEETLKIAGGRVPLVVELKMDDPSSRVCELSAPLLSKYRGEYCLESFHPAALIRWKKLMKHDVRGQLSAPFKNHKKEKLKYFILRNLLTNYLTRPDFIAYEHSGGKNISLRLCRAMGATAIAWTVRSQSELNKCKKYFDSFIFENFIPENHE